MEGHALWVKDHQLVLEADGRKFLSDANPMDLGACPPTPEGYFTAALAGIILNAAATALRHHRFEPKGLRVTVKAHYLGAPERMESFEAKVELPSGLTNMLEAAARRAVQDNPYLRLFIHPMPVALEFIAPVSA
jgi:uncharacterized OsmC-like protein